MKIGERLDPNYFTAPEGDGHQKNSEEYAQANAGLAF